VSADHASALGGGQLVELPQADRGYRQRDVVEFRFNV
jgi:hypothetical protein